MSRLRSLLAGAFLAIFVGTGTAKPVPAEKGPAATVVLQAEKPKLVRAFPELPPSRQVKVRMENQGKETVVLSPLVHLQLFEGKRSVPHDVYIGAGFVGPELIKDLEKRFLVIPPGKAAHLNLHLDNHDVGDRVYGWKLKRPGSYRLVLRYQFDRKAFAKVFLQPPFVVEADEVWAGRPERAWNRALEMERTLTVEFEVPR